MQINNIISLLHFNFLKLFRYIHIPNKIFYTTYRGVGLSLLAFHNKWSCLLFFSLLSSLFYFFVTTFTLYSSYFITDYLKMINNILRINFTVPMAIRYFEFISRNQDSCSKANPILIFLILHWLITVPIHEQNRCLDVCRITWRINEWFVLGSFLISYISRALKHYYYALLRSFLLI